MSVSSREFVPIPRWVTVDVCGFHSTAFMGKPVNINSLFLCFTFWMKANKGNKLSATTLSWSAAGNQCILVYVHWFGVCKNVVVSYAGNMLVRYISCQVIDEPCTDVPKWESVDAWSKLSVKFENKSSRLWLGAIHWTAGVIRDYSACFSFLRV